MTINAGNDEIYEITIDGTQVREVTVDGVIAWVEANFDVRNLSAPNEVTEGDNFTVTADVKNTGDGRDTQTISFNRGGSTDKTLKGGETVQDITFNETINSTGTFNLSISSADDTESRNITVESAIPDVSMFQQPIHQYVASQNYNGNWTDVISGITATPDGSPSKTSVSGRDAIFYQSGDDHTYTDSTVSGEFSMFAVIRTDSSQTNYGFSAGSVGAGPKSGSYHINSFNGLSGPSGGSFPTNTWTSMGFTHDSNDVYYVYGGGNSSHVASEAGPDVSGFGIGTRIADDNSGFVGYVNEVVVTNAKESGSAYQQWHNARF